MLKRASLESSKATTFLMVLGSMISKIYGVLLTDHIAYRILVGAM